MEHLEHCFVKVDDTPEGAASPPGKIITRALRMADKDYSSTPLTTKLGAKAGADVVVYFTTRRDELERRFAKLQKTLAPPDGLWIAYPKRSSRVETDLTFEAVQRIGLEAGLVDNKSIAFDDDWSAVRFVYRLEDR
jgi:hypothetical protein